MWRSTGRLTCWTLQCWTVSAVSLTTPGSSLRCCSQQRDRSRPGWADMADKKMDWWRAACRLDSVGAERHTGQGWTDRGGQVVRGAAAALPGLTAVTCSSSSSCFTRRNLLGCDSLGAEPRSEDESVMSAPCWTCFNGVSPVRQSSLPDRYQRLVSVLHLHLKAGPAPPGDTGEVVLRTRWQLQRPG